MKFTENTGLVLEICKVMNLTVWKFITSMAGVLSPKLLPQMQVELGDYMQACTIRAPFLAALKSGTVDDVNTRVSVMGAVTAEWRVNRRVRQLTAKLQREIMKRQVEEQHVPTCSAAWIYQDFPVLLSEAKAESFSISVLCDLILTRYDLTKDKEFRELLQYVQSDLKRQNAQLNQGKHSVSRTNQYPTHMPTNQSVSTTNQYPTHRPTNQSVSKTNQYPRHVPTNQRTHSLSKTNHYPRHEPTTYVPHTSTESNALPVLAIADWFSQYQPAQCHTDVPLFGPTGLITDSDSRVRPQHKSTNCYNRPNNGHMSTADSSRRNFSVNSYTRPVAKTSGYSTVCHEPREQEEVPQFGHHHYTNTGPNSVRQSADLSESRQSVRPHIQANKQTYNTQGRMPKPYKRVAEPKPKTNTEEKSFDQKLDDYLSRVCPDTKQAGATVTESKSPEFSSSHMGGLVIKIAKKPKSVQITESKQPEKELTKTEQNRHAFNDQLERIQAMLRENMKAEANTGKNVGKPKDHGSTTSYRIPIVANGDKPAATGSATIAQTNNPHKRKTTDSSMCSNIQNKCAHLDTGSAANTNPRKRKASNSASCSSIQNKCARLDSGSALKALKRHVDKRNQ